MADEKEDDDDDNSCSDNKENDRTRSRSDKVNDKDFDNAADGNGQANVLQDDNNRDRTGDYYGCEDDDYEDEVGDFDGPEKASRITEDSTYASIPGLSNSTHHQLQGVIGRSEPALNESIIRMFPGLPMQGILTEQSIQGSCILVRVQDAIERISQNITNDQLEELGFELEDITRLVREFEGRATEINIQLM